MSYFKILCMYVLLNFITSMVSHFICEPCAAAKFKCQSILGVDIDSGLILLNFNELMFSNCIFGDLNTYKIQCTINLSTGLM